MSLTCYHCKTEMYPVHSRKLDGFLQTKYSCKCGKAEPGIPDDFLPLESIEAAVDAVRKWMEVPEESTTTKSYKTVESPFE